MPVDTQHPDYTESLADWTMVSDCVSGQSAIKSKAATYLPSLPDATGNADTNRYGKYIARAYFMNVTGRTLDSLRGMAFRKSSTLTLPESMGYMDQDADDTGQSVEQMAKAAFTGIAKSGRYFFLADFSRVPAGLSAEDEVTMGARPFLRGYTSESVINWRVENSQLVMAVLVEQLNASNDEFGHETVEQYRVLRMRDGVYTQQVYDNKNMPITEETIPTMSGGAAFTWIPFYKAGAENNLVDYVDSAPLYDMSVLNIAHYQTTADHRENLHVHGQLTLGITTDLDSATWAELYPKGVSVGARAGIYLGTNGSFHTATCPESSSLRIGLADLEGQMVAIGARLIQRGGGTETAEAARINASAETSALDDIVSNLSAAMESALKDCAMFAGANTDEISYELNRDFWESRLDTASLQAIIAARTAGLIGSTDALHMIRMGKLELRKERTDDEILLEVADDLLNSPAESGNNGSWGA